MTAAHPLLSAQSAWLAFDDRERQLRQDHRAELTRIEKHAGKGSAADRLELASRLAEAAFQHRTDLGRLRHERADWLTSNADALTDRVRSRGADLVLEVARHVDGFTPDEQVRGLADIAVEATSLRELFTQLVAAVSPGMRPPDLPPLTPAALVASVMAGADLLTPLMPARSDLGTLRPVGGLQLADDQPASVLTDAAPVPVAAGTSSYVLQRDVTGWTESPAEEIDRADVDADLSA